MIVATSGAELCATSTRPNVRPMDCIRATDHTYKGVVDLTARVSVGEPIPLGDPPHQWKVPYNVMDDAGNKAKTVWRSVIVEEVSLDEFESSHEAAVLANRKEEVDNAVREALDKERKRVAATSRSKQACPPCEPCDCKGKKDRGGMSVTECNSYCDEKMAAVESFEDSCPPTYTESSSSYDRTVGSHRIIQDLVNYMEGLIGPSALAFLLCGCTVVVILYTIQRLLRALFFSSGPYVRTYYADEEREKMMMQNVSYYRSPSAPTNRNSTASSTPSSSISRPPTASLSSQRNGIFSPQQNGANTSTTNSSQPSPFRSPDGTDNPYQSVSPITPSRNGNAPQGYNLRSNR